MVEDLKLASDPELFGRHIAELNATNNALVRAYVWGLDLSETLDGAGGVGGLLWVRMNTGPATGTHFVCYDGNGNVWNLVSASTGTETARYEYGPFGEPLRLSGVAARTNPFRFSTKRAEDFAGLVPYEYRAYRPTSGRWFSRDPIGELGAEALLQRKASSARMARRGFAELLPEGPNLFGFVHNNPVSLVDADGRAIPPAVVAALAVLAATEASVWPQYKAAFNRYPDSGDKFKHCWVSCRISKTCGGSIAELAGLGKEVRDRAVAVYCDYFPNSEICQGAHGDFWDSIQDLQANQQCIGWESIVAGPVGGWIGALCRRSCEDCCKAKVGYHTGEP
ncbi:RHS repeat domain-containing protein [Limisphaera sp. 4302-co]